MKAGKNPSGGSSRRSSRKRPTKVVGDALIGGLDIAVRHVRGEVDLPGYRLGPHDTTAASELSDAQRNELRARLAHHRAHPDEPRVTLDDIRRRVTRR